MMSKIDCIERAGLVKTKIIEGIRQTDQPEAEKLG